MTEATPNVIVRVAWTPARSEPDHGAEMTNQWVCGEALEVLEEAAGWLRCRDAGGFEAWTPVGGLRRATAEEAGEWIAGADAVSLGTGLVPAGEVGRDGGASETERGTGDERRRPPLPIPPRLPLGSRVRWHDDGTVGLPTGLRGRPLERGGVVRASELPRRFRPSGGALVATARRWLGVPYVWGGRTEWGFDCSGLVQAVFRLHGTELPRDSGPQRAAGPDVPGLPRAGDAPLPFPELLEPLEPGDLLFFAPEGRGITHVAIHEGGGRILHAAASNGCVAADDLGEPGSLEERLRASVVAVTRPLDRAAKG